MENTLPGALQDKQYEIDRVREVLRQTPIGIGVTVINSFILVLVLWGRTPDSKLILWLFTVLLISLSRTILQHFVTRKEINSDNVNKCRNLFLFTLFISGCVWGSAGIFLLPPSSIAYQVFIAFVLGGMIAGSVGVFASVMGAFYCFSIPIVLAVTVNFMKMDTGIHFAMGIMMTLFWFIMLMTAKKLNREIVEFLDLKYENIDLISSLEREIKERKGAEDKLIKRNQEIENIVQKRTSELRNLNKKLLREIEERKEITIALEESEAKYRELANSLPQIVFETDEKGNITFVNRNAFDIFGYSHNELETGFNLLQILAPSEHQRALENFQEVFNGKKFVGNEYTALRKDGSTFPISVHSDLIVRDGEIVGTRGIVIDLTRQKQEEEEKKKLELQLQRAQKMEALGTLAGGVAHDLNNILSGIVGYPDLLLMQIPEDSPLRKPVLTMQNSGKKAAAIVQDLLTLTRRNVVIEEIVNLNDIVDSYMQSPEHEKLMSFHPSVNVVTNLESELLDIKGSPIHLTKTVMNLVSNAAEAMTEGGTINIVTKNIYLDSVLRGYDKVDEGDYVVLRVTDNGIGISSEDIERIFEPFFTKKVMGKSGTGLGMAVVWGSVKDHNGYIDVQSREGEGTEFTLYFPVSRSDSKDAGFKEETGIIRSEGESILVVDDVEEQWEIAEAMLSKMGYNVSSVASGEDAVDYIKECNVDLLVLDMVMSPGMDGLDTYRKIKEINPSQKAVIASGFSETVRVKEAQSLGAGRYIKKPYTYKSLGQAVRNELDRV